MKKLNKKGFTLIELLAVIIILGVLLLIAVPSVSKYIQQSREKTYATNLSKLIEGVSINVNAYESDYQFKTTEFLIVPFACIDLERGSNTKSPFSNYVANQSFVIVDRTDAGFTYLVTAVDDSGFGTAVVSDGNIKISSVDPTALSKITKGTDESGNTVYTADVQGFATTKTAHILVCDAFADTF